VPDALSIVSFEDSVLTRIVHPPITSLTRDAFSLGQQAARSVLAAVDSPDSIRDLKTATPALTVRGSTAAPATAAAA
jgi:DNA-binding LacI/PurR family transcriptional regulator